MRSRLEIVNRLAKPADANELLFSPAPDAPSYRRTRVYDIDFSGDGERMKQFIGGVLADEICEETIFDGVPAHAGAAAIIEVSVKPEILDPEKEYILRIVRGRPADDFQIHHLAVIQRYYIDHPADENLVHRLTHDLANPAVQEWVSVNV